MLLDDVFIGLLHVCYHFVWCKIGYRFVQFGLK